MEVKYKELQNGVWPPLPPKWKSDPDVDPNQKFHPRSQYFINGNLVRQGEIKHSRVSSQPFLEIKVPRRGGLQQVFPHENDYLTLAREQGLFHLIPDYNKQAFDSNQQQTNNALHSNTQINGITPPSSERSKSINELSPVGPPPSKLPNGVNPDVDAATEDALES